MQTYRLALIGFGTVGQGLAQILRDEVDQLATKLDLAVSIVAVTDSRYGSLYDPNGLNPSALLTAVTENESIADLRAQSHGWDAQRTIAEASADIVIELSFTDLQTGEPATSHIRQALSLGRHVITTNKGPVALHFAELDALARQYGVGFELEGTVMSGTPVLRMGREALGAAGIERVAGILNGTSNFILTEMEEGATYAEALKTAQNRGFAEADPTGDVDGHDAAAKLVILAHRLLGVPMRLEQVEREGIRDFSPEAVADARVAGQRWKLLAQLESHDGELRAQVRPERISSDHPLAGVMGATNAIVISTRLLGDITVVGPGAGRLETAYAIVEDIAAIARGAGATQAPRGGQGATV